MLYDNNMLKLDLVCKLNIILLKIIFIKNKWIKYTNK